MIELTRLNGSAILINENKVQYIESIPESKIVMENKDYYLVKESFEEIILKIADFNAMVSDKEQFLKGKRTVAEI